MSSKATFLASKFLGSTRPLALTRPTRAQAGRLSLLGRLPNAFVNAPTLTRAMATSQHGKNLQEYFAVVWNNPWAVAPTEEAENLSFQDDQIVVTFSGEMMAPSGLTPIGVCFACQAPSEEHVKNAVRLHETSLKGIWNANLIEVSALETVHTSDYEK
ncbi:hypothetical protein BGW36DRAFT_212908 [Talaromyces proteolyticus]|uniref:Uncharacterized protein n=1 Tax=Talaromyces proteolyticus TaxID=1131652 RepID=A0AAD4KMU2_9EURO|nr:uncharacterized protein BGW36DRAFT_212908 [Talaromyces proteolyticus]KAH8693935.1 hypothetical protein BGW36DRAFT_212908 [Talaromyces proteolyticus]